MGTIIFVVGGLAAVAILIGVGFAIYYQGYTRGVNDVIARLDLDNIK